LPRIRLSAAFNSRIISSLSDIRQAFFLLKEFVNETTTDPVAAKKFSSWLRFGEEFLLDTRLQRMLVDLFPRSTTTQVLDPCICRRQNNAQLKVNLRRHSGSNQAMIGLDKEGDRVVLQITLSEEKQEETG